MDDKNYSINEFIMDPIKNSTWCFNFYDWFCKDHTLETKVIKLAKKVKFLLEHGILNGAETYAWFKNNCPMSGSLYDDIRISALDDGKFYGGFCPKSGHHINLKCEVWMLNNTNKTNNLKNSYAQMEVVESHNMKYYRFKTWAELKAEIRNNSMFRNELKNHFNK